MVVLVVVAAAAVVVVVVVVVVMVVIVVIVIIVVVVVVRRRDKSVFECTCVSRQLRIVQNEEVWQHTEQRVSEHVSEAWSMMCSETYLMARCTVYDALGDNYGPLKLPTS